MSVGREYYVILLPAAGGKTAGVAKRLRDYCEIGISACILSASA